MGKKADAKIKTFVKLVRGRYKLDKAIFFGSRARGDYFKDSDYDIILISSDFKNIFFSKRIALMYDFWNFYPLDIEPLGYTPEEFEVKKKQIGIVQEAVKEGIEI